MSPAHKTELLVVRDLVAKRRFATKAAQQGCSRQTLREDIPRHRQRPQGGPSRTGLRATVRALRVAAKRVRQLMAFPGTPLAVPRAEQEQLLVLLDPPRRLLDCSAGTPQVHSRR